MILNDKIVIMGSHFFYYICVVFITLCFIDFYYMSCIFNKSVIIKNNGLKDCDCTNESKLHFDYTRETRLHAKNSLIVHKAMFACLQNMKGDYEYKQFVMEMIFTTPVHEIYPVFELIPLSGPGSLSLEGMIMEFGVFSGNSIRLLANRYPTRTIHGFDSFIGLPEHWTRGDTNSFSAGTFKVNELPSVPSNVKLHKGWFNETIYQFLNSHVMENIALLHVDCDLFSSTQTVLTLLAPYIKSGTYILFDELYNYPGYEEHELLALWIFLKNNNMKIEIIGKYGDALLCPEKDNGAQFQSVLIKIM